MKNKDRGKRSAVAASIAICAFFCSAGVALAERTDPDMIPPDVTLTTGGGTTSTAAAGAASAAASTPAPGLVSPGGAAGAASGPAGITNLPSGAAIINGNMVPKSGKITATMMKPPGTGFSNGQGAPPPPPAGSSGYPLSAAKSNGLYQGSGQPVDPNAPDPIAVLETSKGTIQIRLFRKYAPKTVDNFMDLITKGFYNGLTFHRVEPGFCIQGGDPNGDGTGVYIDPESHTSRFLPLETSPTLRHNQAGVVAMARGQSQDSASCQFYITLGAQPSLDNQYAVFGGVISGMEVVNSIVKGDKIVSVSLRAQ